MSRCVVNFAKGAWYPGGQERLVNSLTKQGYNGDLILSQDESNIGGSPTHQESPYAFKPHIIKKAVDAGHTTVLWCDAAVWAQKPVEPVFEYIEEHGYLFAQSGFMVGNYTSDACLESFGVTRDHAWKMLMLMGCFMGFDFRRETCKRALQWYLEKSLDGVTFPGDWFNDRKQVSKDEKVLGHRHDQSAISIIAWELAMKVEVMHDLFQYYYNEPNDAIFLSQGM